MIRIVTDSTADIPKELTERYDITVVPLKVIFNGQTTFRDGVDISPEQFYQRLAGKNDSVTTSQPTPQEFLEVYKKMVDECSSIISIHISTAMSGTYMSACLARDMLANEDITVIDSQVVSMGLGLIVLEAARAAKAGHSKGDVLKLIQKMKEHVQIYFIVDTLEYLAKGGRIGKAQAFIGTLLSIKPLLYLKDGLVQPYDRIRGRTRAIERLVQVVEEKVDNRQFIYSIVYGVDLGGKELLLKKLSEHLPLSKPIISEVGAVVGTHTGPGVLGVAFLPQGTGDL